MSERRTSDPPVSKALFARARLVTPGGVNSPVRAFGAVGGTPRFMVAGRGAYVSDADGNEYVDFVGAWGPAILGHSHPDVVAAVSGGAERGLGFGAPCPGEVALACEIVDRVGPVEQVRLVASGTEATMTAVRLARGFTGRSKIVKFAGCYHGHVDALLAEAGSGAATLGLPGSAGVTSAQAGDTIVLPYNDADAVAEAFATWGRDIACVITEAAAANMGVVAPRSGFNKRLASLCRDHGALLIFDEVMTGFRVSGAGWWGLEGAVEGWAPDLFTFGKVIGGGLPVAALGGRAEVMAHLAPVGDVYQAGTLSGNPVAVACGLATLLKCDSHLYEHLDRTAEAVGDLVGEALAAQGVPHTVQRAGNLFSVLFASGGATNYEQVKRQNTAAFAAFFNSLLASGISLPPSAFEAWFVSAAHDDRVLDRLADALPDAAAAASAVS